MPDLALRGISQELHRELKAAAKRNHRSLNGEILARLATSLRPAPVDAVTLLERIQRRHRTLGPLEMDESAIRRLRAEGPSGDERRRSGDKRRPPWRGGE